MTNDNSDQPQNLTLDVDLPCSVYNADEKALLGALNRHYKHTDRQAVARVRFSDFFHDQTDFRIDDPKDDLLAAIVFVDVRLIAVVVYEGEWKPESVEQLAIFANSAGVDLFTVPRDVGFISREMMGRYLYKFVPPEDPSLRYRVVPHVSCPTCKGPMVLRWRPNGRLNREPFNYFFSCQFWYVGCTTVVELSDLPSLFNFETMPIEKFALRSAEEIIKKRYGKEAITYLEQEIARRRRSHLITDVED